MKRVKDFSFAPRAPFLIYKPQNQRKMTYDEGTNNNSYKKKIKICYIKLF